MAAPSDSSDQLLRRNHDPPEINQAVCAACEIAQRFMSLIEAGLSVIVCLSPDYRILEFNHAAEQLYGLQRSVVLGQDYINLFLPEAHQKAVAEDIKRVLDGHPTRGFENSVRTPDGEERVLLWSVSRVLDAAGQPTGVIAVGQDITERKQAEEALHRYEHIVRSSNDFMAFVDTDYIYLAVNATYVEAFGKTQDQIVGHKVADLLGDEVFGTQLKLRLDRCLAGERVLYQLWLDLPRWGRRCLDVHLNPFRGTDGSVSGVVVVGRDITERQQATQTLIEQKRQLRTMASELALAGQRERRRVAIGLHDQVGQALAMAKLKLCTVLDSELSVNARRSLEESQVLLDQSIQATRSLTFQLNSVVLQELGLEAALQQLVEWFDAQNHGTRFVFETDNQAKPVGEDQDLMLYDIARELLFNATKYARARTVSLRVECVCDKPHITIKDDAVGFDTACPGDGPSAEGGVGYFSIRERLAYLGGALEVASAIGHGTQILVAVPLDES